MAQQKKKRISAGTPTAIFTMKVQENKDSEYQNIDKSYAGNIKMESNLAYGTVKEQENEEDMPTYENIDETPASNINTESNLVYRTANELSFP